MTKFICENFISIYKKSAVGLIVLIMLSACGSNDSQSITTNRTSITIPGNLQKLSTNGGTLRAYITLDNDTDNRQEMDIDSTGGGSASITISNLSLAVHQVLITYEYTDASGTIILATANDSIDLSAGGQANLNFDENKYDFLSYDQDKDGVSNAKELQIGTNPRVSAPPVIAATASLKFAAIKTFRFKWNDVADATYYRLMENIDGSSGFTQVGENIQQGVQTVDIIVPLYARLNAQYMLESCNKNNCTPGDVITSSGTMAGSIGYFKSSNAAESDAFSRSISLSGDGLTLAVGATGESSSAIGVNGDQNNNTAPNAGAVYVFHRDGNRWTQQAYLKAGNTGENDLFGFRLSLSDDGNALAVSAIGEDSNGVTDQSNNSASLAGAVYVFTRNANEWQQQAFVKAENAAAGDRFGRSISLNGKGDRLAVGADREDNSARGVSLSETSVNSDAEDSGAAYIFDLTASGWQQTAYIKASNTRTVANFGDAVDLSGDGKLLVVGAPGEASSIAAGQNDSSSPASGAVYLFALNAQNNWAQLDFVKANNGLVFNRFGGAVELSDNGETLVVGAAIERSNATGVNGVTSGFVSASGAAYVYIRVSVNNWVEQAYIKASNRDDTDNFGISLSLSGDGNTLAVMASEEDGNAIGFRGDQNNNSALDSGAVYTFVRNNSNWRQQSYIKASNTVNKVPVSLFGIFYRTVSLSRDGSTLAFGDFSESSNATNINGDQTNKAAPNAGAVYLY